MAKGFVYVLRNEAMPGLLKIGHSVKVPTERKGELFTTGVPEPFNIAYYCLVENVKQIEAAAHRTLSEFRYRKDREFFQVELNTAIQAITAWCNPEHEWHERTNAEAAKNVLPAQPFGIKTISRHDLDYESKEMTNFVEAAKNHSLAPYVRSLFYDSNSCCCNFELADDVKEFSPVAAQLLEIALQTIGQFEWFGRIQHGKPLNER